jgi:hypothetical protein
MVLELPLGLLGGALLYKRLLKNPEVQELIRLFRDGKDILEKLLAEYKKNNGG